MPNNKQLKAEVLAHWNRMLELSVDDIRAGKEAPHSANCAFCREYCEPRIGYGVDCVGCPVMMETGCEQCLETPWYDVACLYEEIEAKERRRLSEFRKAVKAEIDFLEKLEV